MSWNVEERGGAEGRRGVTRVRHCEERVKTVGGTGARQSIQSTDIVNTETVSVLILLTILTLNLNRTKILTLSILIHVFPKII